MKRLAARRGGRKSCLIWMMRWFSLEVVGRGVESYHRGKGMGG